MNASGSSSYAKLRETNRPQLVRLLLIGESAPDPGASEPRFFYAKKLDRRDNLFRGVVAALLDTAAGRAGADKQPLLDELRAAGVYLIDLVPVPVDKMDARARAKARRDHVQSCVEVAKALAPKGIVVCHAPSFRVLSKPLKEARLPLLHDDAIPFPLGNHRSRFVAMVRAARAKMSSVA